MRTRVCVPGLTLRAAVGVERDPLSPQSNLTLLSTNDRQTLRRLVEILLSQGLTFLQARQEDGHYEYVLEPYERALYQRRLRMTLQLTDGRSWRVGGLCRRVDLVVRFTGLPGKPLLNFPYAARQLIANEARRLCIVDRGPGIILVLTHDPWVRMQVEAARMRSLDDKRDPMEADAVPPTSASQTRPVTPGRTLGALVVPPVPPPPAAAAKAAAAVVPRAAPSRKLIVLDEKVRDSKTRPTPNASCGPTPCIV